MSGTVNQTRVTGTELSSVNLMEMLKRELPKVMVAFADAASGRPALKHKKMDSKTNQTKAERPSLIEANGKHSIM